MSDPRTRPIGGDKQLVARMMRVLQFGDSVLPVGAFSFSNALEPAVAENVVRDETTLGGFVLAAVSRAATSDGIALLEAHRAALGHDIERVVAADKAVYEKEAQ